MKKIGEGKTKAVLQDETGKRYFLRFKDDITAFNMEKHEQLQGKGALNCDITWMIYEYLKKNGIDTSYIARTDEITIEVSDVKMIPVEVVVRNRAYGSFLKRFDLVSGAKLDFPLVEFFYKDDERNDPQLTRELFELMDLATPEEIEELKRSAKKINGILLALFESCGISLVDFKIEFGKDPSGKLLLADEIDPDSCRLWGQDGEMLDKERFRKGMGKIVESYKDIQGRLKGVL